MSLDDLCSCVALGLFLGLQLHLLEPLKRLQVDLLGDLGLFEDFSLEEITLYHKKFQLLYSTQFEITCVNGRSSSLRAAAKAARRLINFLYFAALEKTIEQLVRLTGMCISGKNGNFLL